MTRLILALVILSLGTTGCSIYHVNSEEVTENIYASKSSANDIVYIEDISRSYEIVGFVTVNTERSQSMEQVLEKMKREAAILGGDAITNITMSSTDGWKKVPPKRILNNAYIRANFVGTVVAF